MTLRDAVEGRKAEFDESKAQRALAQLRRERDSAKAQVKALEVENAELRRLADIFAQVEAAEPSPPEWLARPVDTGEHRATLGLLLSDMHFDEVVNPDELTAAKGTAGQRGRLNAYDRTIATARLKRWAENVVLMQTHYLSGLEWDGAVVMLGGDGLSGTIHEELRETNAETPFDGLLYWSEMLAAAFDMVLESTGRLHIIAVPGNHGRQTRKPRAKGRARDNLDWILAHMVAREFRHDDRVTFQIPEAADAWFEVYGRGQLLSHGDQVNGGQGVGGIWPPIMRMRGRKADHYASTGHTFETMWIGHWHQYIASPFLVVNGAMKGYDEFAAINSFKFEEAQQAMAVWTPERGLTIQVPVFCADRASEGW